MIEREKYTEAEIVCVKLIEQYPEQIDGLHRYAELYEARGELQRAADYYHPTADFAEKAEGFGKISADFFRKKATQLES